MSSTIILPLFLLYLNIPYTVIDGSKLLFSAVSIQNSAFTGDNVNCFENNTYALRQGEYMIQKCFIYLYIFFKVVRELCEVLGL